MLMHFLVPLITLLTFVSGDELPSPQNETCSCRAAFNSHVILMDVELQKSFCGGVLLNAEQVLTKAICISSRSSGSYKIVIKHSADDPGTEYDVVKHWYHRVHNSTAVGDIAILGIVPKSNSSDSSVACLPFKYPRSTLMGQKVKYFAWMRTPGPKNLLTDGPLLLNSDNLCISDDKYLRRNALCTRDAKNSEIDFHGGEPIYWQSPTTENQLLVGIMISRRHAEDENPIAVILLDMFVDWIELNAPKGITYCRAV